MRGGGRVRRGGRRVMPDSIKIATSVLVRSLDLLVVRLSTNGRGDLHSEEHGAVRRSRRSVCGPRTRSSRPRRKAVSASAITHVGEPMPEATHAPAPSAASAASAASASMMK